MLTYLDIKNFPFWVIINDLSVEKSEYACMAIGVHLRQLDGFIHSLLISLVCYIGLCSRKDTYVSTRERIYLCPINRPSIIQLAVIHPFCGTI